jgi:hypothetical protein
MTKPVGENANKVNMAKKTHEHDLLKDVEQLVTGQMYDRRLNAHWPNIVFEQTGMCRVYSTLSWIHGLHTVGRVDEARLLADMFWRAMEKLSRTDTQEVSVNGGNQEVPRCLTAVYDDGTFNSLAFGRYFLTDRDELDRLNAVNEKAGNPRLNVLERAMSPYAFWSEIIHVRGICGGLIYHGPGSGETFTVRLDDLDTNYWSVNT